MNISYDLITRTALNEHTNAVEPLYRRILSFMKHETNINPNPNHEILDKIYDELQNSKCSLIEAIHLLDDYENGTENNER